MAQNKKNIPLYNLDISKETIANVTKTLKSGWLSPGKNVAEFEKRIANLLKVPYAVGVSSATVGLHLLLESIKNNNKNEVITSPFTMVATIEAILMAGCKPVLVDIEPDSMTIDPEEVERKINKKTLAVTPVDFAGHPADYQRLKKICFSHNVHLISDSAHAIGSLYKNKSIAAYTDASVISFHATKNLSCGEGGVVLTRNKKMADKIRLMVQHGMSHDARLRKKQEDSWRYDVTHQGYKANLSELHAAVGLGQLKKFRSDQSKRKRLAKRYITNLSDLSDFITLPQEQKYATHGWHLFVVRLNLSKIKMNRDVLIRRLKKLGIECGVHYIPVFDFSYYRKNLKFNAEEFLITLETYQQVITLPLYPSLTFSDIDYICRMIQNLIKDN